MPGEGKDDEELTPIEPSADGKVTLEKDSEGKYPKVVPWGKHVAAKETISRKLQTSEDKVKNLEEQLKNAPNREEHDKIVKELADKTAELEKVKTELNQGKEKTANELREVLRGTKTFSDDELNKMSEAELRVAVKATGSKNPSLPDIAGGGGGSGDLSKLSRTELARQAYSSSNKK